MTKIELGEVVSAIKLLLDRLGSDCSLLWSDRAWTRAIKEEIGNLGGRMKWQVSAAGFPGQFEQEWLYDLVWYREDPNRRLSEVGLILESEWKPSWRAIKYDFEKLLIGNVPVKVMICQTRSSTGLSASQTLHELKAAIDTFHTEAVKEVYLLAVFDHASNVFLYRQVPEDIR